jgi:hypothetical protein
MERQHRETYTGYIRSTYNQIGGTGFRFFHSFIGTIFKANEMVAKSVVRLEKTRDQRGELWRVGSESDIYDKWSQAIASCGGLIREACSAANGRLGAEFQSFIFPIVVIPDNSLWVVDYRGDGTVAKEAYEVESCDYFIGKEMSADAGPKSDCLRISHVRFMTLTGFKNFITCLRVTASYWDTWFPPNSSPNWPPA